MASTFTPSHRGGSGPPMVCLHGFTDTWRTWELVLPALERHHDVLAPTLAGHAGGPPIAGEVSDAAIADAVERAMDEAGFETAHVVGNSLGGYIAMQLAARGRAETVVALAPAGGWAAGDDSYRETLDFFTSMQELLKAAAPHAEAILASPEGRRRATGTRSPTSSTSRPSCSPTRCVGAAGCAAAALIDFAPQEGWHARRRADHLPGADRLGHRRPAPAVAAAAARYRATGCRTPTGSSSRASATAPSSTSRLETAQLILGFTSG